MPNYVPIQDLTGKSSISDSDYVPVSDGSTAYGVRAELFKTYSTEAAEAAAAAAEAAAAQAVERVPTYTDYPFSVNNYRINPSTGAAVYTSNQNCTQTIPCYEGEQITVKARTTWYQGSSIAAILAFYNNLGELIVSYDRFSDTESSNTTGVLTVNAPQNAAYFRAGSQVIQDQYVKAFDVEDTISSVSGIGKDVDMLSGVVRLTEGNILIKANTAHSSDLDRIYTNIKSGERFTVYVDGTISTCQIYARYANSTSSRISMSKFYNGVATNDITDIGIYVAQANATATEIIKVYVYAESGMYGIVESKLPYKRSLSQIVYNYLPSNLSRYNVTTDYATKMQTAIEQWMSYCAGDFTKVPFVVHTDQHGRLSDSRKGIFDLLSNLIHFDNISAVFNLGDSVVDHWVDNSTFSGNPLLVNDELEAAARCVASIPSSKQINVYGNHDTWYSGTVPTSVSGVLPSLKYNNPYFRPCGLRTKPCLDNSGFQVVYDDVFNVKYLVLGSWDYADKPSGDTGYQWYWINKPHLEWVISEMAKNDGYDLVLVSHVPLEMGGTGSIDPITLTNIESQDPVYITHYTGYLVPLWNARKAKTSGSITYNNETIAYDFTNCTTDCLCALAGHTHYDGVEYLNGNGLLQVAFDWFSDNTIHFGVLDRSASKIKCWKISTPDNVQTWEKTF